MIFKSERKILSLFNKKQIIVCIFKKHGENGKEQSKKRNLLNRKRYFVITIQSKEKQTI